MPFQINVFSFFVSFIPVEQEVIDGLSTFHMRFVVGVFKDKLLQFRKLALDSVEPRSVGRCPDQCDQVLACPTAHLFPFMGREIIQNQKNLFVLGVTSTHPLHDFKRLLPTFTAPNISPEHVLMNIIKRQEVSNPVWSTVGRRETVWLFPPCPC